MKYLNILLIMVCFAFNVQGQILEIYEEAKDAINAAELEIIAGLEKVSNEEQNAEMEIDSKKTTVLKDQKKTLKDISKVMSEISDALRRYSTIKNAFFYMGATLKYYVRINKYYSEKRTTQGKPFVSAENMTNINNYLFSFVKTQKRGIENIKLIIDKEKTKMSEGQRLKLLYKEEEKMNRTYQEIKKIDQSTRISKISYL